MTHKLVGTVMFLSLLFVACGGSTVSITEVEPLQPTNPETIGALLVASDRPIVLNVWASWCVPCRSEAPLLRTANDQFGQQVRFIGIDVRDSQDGARKFIAEFGLNGFTHFFDRDGSVPAGLRGFGVPLTFFFAPGGELIHLHSGVIDERTLALQIDELLQR